MSSGFSFVPFHRECLFKQSRFCAPLPKCEEFHYTTEPPVINAFESTRPCQSIAPKDNRQVQFELIHDQLPLAVPCYDLFPVTELTVGPPYGETSGIPGSLELTGGEYKT